MPASHSLPAADATSCTAELFAETGRAEQDHAAWRRLVHEDWLAYERRRRSARQQLQPVGTAVQRLKTSSSESAGSFSRRLNCLRPVRRIEGLERHHCYDDALLSLKLKRGRACQQALCSRDRCGLHVLDGVITPLEADALIAHGRSVLELEDASADVPYVAIDFMRSSMNGSAGGHLLRLRVAERLRRLAAHVFDLPLTHVGVAETLLALRRVPTHLSRAGVDSPDGHSQYHCDEALAPFFHFSSVVWLNRHGDVFEGGELMFLHNRTLPWLVVEPDAGRAAIFSSGWENVHGIKPLRRGERWALSVILFVDDGESARQALAGRSLGRRFREDCVRPHDKSRYPHCRANWAATMAPLADSASISLTDQEVESSSSNPTNAPPSGWLSVPKHLVTPPEYLRAAGRRVGDVRVTLNDTLEMPVVAYGTYRAHGQSLKAGVLEALRAGYRHIDTAAAYSNEGIIAEAISESGVRREEIFITTKLWTTEHGYSATHAAVRRSLSELRTGYIDLYLFHAPHNHGRTPVEAEWLRRESWEAMGELREQRVLRSVGVSNFAPWHLQQLKSWGGALPAVNQVEFHPHMLQLGLLEACQADGIQLQAYGLMGAAGVLSDPTVADLAAKHGRSPAQITLRHALQLGAAVLAKSVTASRIVSNANLFDFELSEEDMRTLNELHRNQRSYWDNSGAI